MDESSDKKEQSPSEINREQARAALGKLFSAAASAAFYIRTKNLADRTPADYSLIEQHKSNLLRFAPELMDDRFAEEVAGVVRECNEILDAPLTSTFNT